MIFGQCSYSNLVTSFANTGHEGCVTTCCVTGGNVVSVGRIGGMETNMSSLSLDQIQAADFTFLKKLMDLRKVHYS